jgi:glycopeptide antibiotics resistance protein
MKRNTTKIIFAIYSLILIWIVLFKMAFSVEEIRLLQTTRSVNLIPFYYDTDAGRIQMREVLLNVIVFIPMGLYLKMFAISTGKVILYGFCGSFVFEFCQFLFAIGGSDITDIITNTLGTIVGMCLYALLRKIFSNEQKADRFINRTAAIAILLFGALTFLLFLANKP